MDPDSLLTYVVSAKSKIAVVTFTGIFTKSAETVLNDCENDVNALKGVEFVILNMQPVRDLEADSIRSFVKFQVTLREKFGQMRICYLDREIAKRLEAKAAIRPGEVDKDIAASLQVVVNATNVKGGK